MQAFRSGLNFLKYLKKNFVHGKMTIQNILVTFLRAFPVVFYVNIVTEH